MLYVSNRENGRTEVDKARPLTAYLMLCFQSNNEEFQIYGLPISVFYLK
jgi:hypothetical protein